MAVERTVCVARGWVQGIYQVDSGIYKGKKLQPVTYSAWDPDAGYAGFAFDEQDDDDASAAAAGKKTVFLSHLYINMLILPRQARDKHRKTQKSAVFLQVGVFLPPVSCRIHSS